ncbi:type I pantothenate kinase [Ornithinimicrobium humiphilum]|uniref:Pantothenate kinase n=1 Tax=Ornithinimicrobium humiphilum TaxID=125288 RepID=A0A543KKY7_9MICO|nr:type I pantothenate kinase [Ornithinimicrobium humiphilum]TQM95742.1 pantothenate kinase [Ornithinimicrobium humiphilum]
MGSQANGAVIPSPYVELDRADWARLREEHPMHLDAADVERLRGLGEPLDMAEVEQVYLPISRLLSFYEEATGALHQVTSDFLLERQPERTPFVIGVAGSVAVGKSTTARILAELIRRWPSSPEVSLVTTDGFLHPNVVLRERGLMERKGFPESYDRRALLRFVSEVKAGRAEVRAPVYSHLVYDIVPDEEIVVRQPDVLIVEGLNVLQPPRPHPNGRGPGLAVSDFFDFSVYVDAHVCNIKKWYIERFLRLRETAFADPHSHFHRYASLSDDEAVLTASDIWDSINEPNLINNILPTRSRATLVLLKGADHSVDRVRLRRL